MLHRQLLPAQAYILIDILGLKPIKTNPMHSKKHNLFCPNSNLKGIFEHSSIILIVDTITTTAAAAAAGQLLVHGAHEIHHTLQDSIKDECSSRSVHSKYKIKNKKYKVRIMK